MNYRSLLSSSLLISGSELVFFRGALRAGLQALELHLTRTDPFFYLFHTLDLHVLRFEGQVLKSLKIIISNYSHLQTFIKHLLCAKHLLWDGDTKIGNAWWLLSRGSSWRWGDR